MRGSTIFARSDRRACRGRDRGAAAAAAVVALATLKPQVRHLHLRHSMSFYTSAVEESLIKG
jgi:hypothetical protein